MRKLAHAGLLIAGAAAGAILSVAALAASAYPWTVYERFGSAIYVLALRGAVAGLVLTQVAKVLLGKISRQVSTWRKPQLALGTIVIIAAALVLIAGFGMDISVPTDNGERVTNLGLIAQQRNWIALGSLGIVVGMALLAWSKSTGKELIGGDDQNERVACPYCAESIKKAAVVCRFCNRDIPTSVLQVET